MIVETTAFKDVFVVTGDRFEDERGRLSKVLVLGVDGDPRLRGPVDEVLSTTNPHAGTVRGLHYQVTPHEQTKRVWVTRGALLDVLVDLRPEESTYGTWLGLELREGDERVLHVPPGIAHGYQTLDDDTRVTYVIAGRHAPEHARTLKWDDPTVGVSWPGPATHISSNDLAGSAWPPPS